MVDLMTVIVSMFCVAVAVIWLVVIIAISLIEFAIDELRKGKK